jgi:hypothetical protein
MAPAASAAFCLHSVTIAVVAKVKPVRKKAKAPATRPGGVPCIILVFSAIALFMFFLYFVLKHANG